MLLAARWDAAIRAASDGRRSLDDAMRAMRVEARHAGRADHAYLDARRISGVMRRYGVVDPEGDIGRYIDAGATVDLPADALTPCTVLEPAAEVRFAPGFDVDTAMKTKRVAGVDPAGAAYAAGLRDGQVMRTMDMFRDPARLATVGVQDSDDDRVVAMAFFPAGEAVQRQRAKLRDDLAPDSLKRCGAMLGVGAR